MKAFRILMLCALGAMFGCVRAVAQPVAPTAGAASSDSFFNSFEFVPVGGNVTDAETTDLVAAVTAYRGGSDRENFTPLEQFLQKYPSSAYQIGGLTNLGGVAYQNMVTIPARLTITKMHGTSAKPWESPRQRINKRRSLARASGSPICIRGWGGGQIWRHWRKHWIRIRSGALT
jgi:hypothetical protein